MNGRKTIIGVALGVTLLLSAVTAEAGLVTWGKNNKPFKGIGGGEFKLTVLESFTGHAVGDQFRSFCLEIEENLSGKPFATTLNEEAHMGGGGAVPSGVNGGPTADPLDPLSAWLYERWRGPGLTITDAGFLPGVYSDTTNVDLA